jgi:hypothetical protein
VLFERQLREGIHDGTVTVAFRRWRRRQVSAGGQYRTGLDIVEVDRVDVVREADITDEDAYAAGYRSARDLVADLRGPADLPLYRIGFRRVDTPDPRSVLADGADLTRADVEAIDRRLDRRDARAPAGPWTAVTLDAIATRPGVAAGDLAASLGLSRDVCKRNVRGLKELGLTISLLVGYELSPRGAAYVKMTRRRVRPDA